MTKKVVPMIHVPDVAATVEWYRDIGFTVVETHGHEGEGLSFAVVAFGESQVMFSEGGGTSTQYRREVDLYVYADDVDDIYESLRGRVEVVERLHDTFYGIRELIIRT
jgi:catechol 2,3-dioxygenase-like lactoylglutathione lyase family enzyme